MNPSNPDRQHRTVPVPESERINTPEENRLLALMQLAKEAAADVITAHNADEDGACGCDICLDAAGLRWNLEMGESAISSTLWDYRAPEALVEEIDRAARVPPPARGWNRENRPEENRLRQLLAWLVDAIPAVQQVHNAREGNGVCGCHVCEDLAGVAYNVRMADDLICNSLVPLYSRSSLLAALDVEVEATAEADADTPDAVVGQSLSEQVPTPPPAVPPRPALRQRKQYWEPSDD